ncbi:uncharacterized protein TNCV_1894481 [Trichonephila clavipes]|nr:uncharacterized protein TNCV_1894481 [Trichonephila clavipes]
MSACGKEFYIACMRSQSSSFEAEERGSRAKRRPTESHMCSVVAPEGSYGHEHVASLSGVRVQESFRLATSRVARDKPWSTLCKKSHGIPSSTRAAAVAKFRLLTGHDCLCAHLFRFNLVTSPICVLCDTGQDMTAAHLDECSALNDLNCIVKRYWRARCLMT